MEKYAKSTLRQFTKEELINHIYILYHNIDVIREAYNNATNFYCKEVMNFTKSLNGIKGDE